MPINIDNAGQIILPADHISEHLERLDVFGFALQMPQQDSLALDPLLKLDHTTHNPDTIPVVRLERCRLKKRLHSLLEPPAVVAGLAEKSP